VNQDYLENEYRTPYAVWRKTPNPETASALLSSLNSVLDSAMRSYAGGASSPSLRSKAKLLALEAIERYDPNRAKLRTHLLSHLRGLRRHAAQASQVVRLPERAALEIGRMKLAEAELADSLGRPPTTYELADHTGLSTKRLARLRAARPGLTEGQVTSSRGDDEPAAQPAVVSPASKEAWLSFVHGGLTPKDQLIFEHAVGFAGQPTLPKGEIATKVGLSPGAVSQRLAKIQSRIDRQGEVEGLF
jgi:DNA-directed RNA polymerase specialized sigma subunit